jgi:hypothetical protein
MIGPHDPVADEVADVLDDLATLATGDDFDAIRGRYLSDDRLRVPPGHHELQQRQAGRGALGAVAIRVGIGRLRRDDTRDLRSRHVLRGVPLPTVQASRSPTVWLAVVVGKGS